jgi:hypothetical protein
MSEKTCEETPKIHCTQCDIYCYELEMMPLEYKLGVDGEGKPWAVKKPRICIKCADAALAQAAMKPLDKHV